MGDVPRALLQEKYLECTEVLKEEQCHEKGERGGEEVLGPRANLGGGLREAVLSPNSSPKGRQSWIPPSVCDSLTHYLGLRRHSCPSSQGSSIYPTVRDACQATSTKPGPVSGLSEWRVQ